MSGFRSYLLCTTLGILPVALACNTALSFDIGALEVVPDTATAGEQVELRFFLLIAPARTVRLSALIDGDAYQIESATLNVNGTYKWPLGDAADMIARYGAGSHSAQVEVLDLEGNRSVSTALTTFQLVDPGP